MRSRDLALAGVHLAVLWAFAFAQPLLDLLGDAPEFFVARGNTRGDILVLAFVLVLAPPLLATLVEGLVGLVSERLRRGLQLCLVGLLVAAFALQLLNDLLSVRAAALLLLATALGALAAFAYARTAAAPAVLTVLGPAPLVFLFLFLVVSPVSKLVLPGNEANAAGVDVPDGTPVVVILFDEFAGYTLNGPDGKIDASRYPSFARLAGDATWYRNATTVADYTSRAVPAMLTGERPEKGALPIASDHPESLFTLLGGDYSLDVTEPMTDICPQRLCPDEDAEREPGGRRLRELTSDLSLVSLHLLVPDSLQDRLAPVDRSFGDFRAADDSDADDSAQQSPDGASRGLAALAAVVDRMKIFRAFEQRLARVPQSRQLVFFHIQMPHNPYHYLPNGQRYPQTVDGLPGLESEGQPAGGGWTRDAALARQGLQRYLLQVGDTDRLLGRLLARMRASGLYDKALIVVLADHGASFVPGTPHRAARADNLVSIAGIPLLVKAPGQHRGRTDESNVSIIDVLPTIADQLDVDLPWPTGGRTALDASDGGQVRLQPHYGDADLTLPFAEYVRRRDRVVRAMTAEFGRGRAGLYRSGPDADLIGSDVAELGAGSAPEGDFELDDGGLLAAVDPAAAIVPSLVSGPVTGLPGGARLAVAVDGRVEAEAVRFQDGDVSRFSAIVSPTAFARGRNRIDLLAITGTGAGRRLALLSGASLGYRLVQSGGRNVIVDPAGARIPVASGDGGAVESLNVGQAEVTIGGWAGDARRRRAADLVISFSGGRLLASARPSLPRKDLAKRYGRALGRAGFKTAGWAGGPTPGSPEAPVRTFAVFGGRALELAPPP